MKEFRSFTKEINNSFPTINEFARQLDEKERQKSKGHRKGPPDAEVKKEPTPQELEQKRRERELAIDQQQQRYQALIDKNERTKAMIKARDDAKRIKIQKQLDESAQNAASFLKSKRGLTYGTVSGENKVNHFQKNAPKRSLSLQKRSVRPKNINASVDNGKKSQEMDLQSDYSLPDINTKRNASSIVDLQTAGGVPQRNRGMSTKAAAMRAARNHQQQPQAGLKSIGENQYMVDDSSQAEDTSQVSEPYSVRGEQDHFGRHRAKTGKPPTYKKNIQNHQTRISSARNSADIHNVMHEQEKQKGKLCNIDGTPLTVDDYQKAVKDMQEGKDLAIAGFGFANSKVQELIKNESAKVDLKKKDYMLSIENAKRLLPSYIREEKEKVKNRMEELGVVTKQMRQRTSSLAGKTDFDLYQRLEANINRQTRQQQTGSQVTGIYPSQLDLQNETHYPRDDGDNEQSSHDEYRDYVPQEQVRADEGGKNDVMFTTEVDTAGMDFGRNKGLEGKESMLTDRVGSTKMSEFEALSIPANVNDEIVEQQELAEFKDVLKELLSKEQSSAVNLEEKILAKMRKKNLSRGWDRASGVKVAPLKLLAQINK